MKGDYDFALGHIWQALNHIKRHPNLVLYLNALLGLGTVYFMKRQFHDSSLYLELAQRSIPETQLPRLAGAIEAALERTQAAASDGPRILKFRFALIPFLDGNARDRFWKPSDAPRPT